MPNILRAFGAEPDGARLQRAQASPQWRHGRFDQGLPNHMDYVGMLVRFLLRRGTKVPTAAVPVEATDPSAFARPPASGLGLTWLGHSSVLVELEGVRVLLDPMWGPRASPTPAAGPKRFFEAPLALERLPDLDAVVLSHDHYDHLDEGTIVALNRRGCLFVAPLGVGAHLERWGVPAERIVELDWWQEWDVKGVTLACVPARHFSGRKPWGQNRTLWSGWVLKGRTRRFYYSGDSGYFNGFKAIGAKYGPFDAACLDCGAYDPTWPDAHLGPEQAVQACLDAGAALLLPMHWATFHLALHGWTEPVERLLVAARAAGVAVAAPRPGQRLDPARPPAPERWWPDAPWDTAAESPVRSTGLGA